MMKMLINYYLLFLLIQSLSSLFWPSNFLCNGKTSKSKDNDNNKVTLTTKSKESKSKSNKSIRPTSMPTGIHMEMNSNSNSHGVILSTQEVIDSMDNYPKDYSFQYSNDKYYSDSSKKWKSKIVKPHSFYYISTSEGILSHFVQLEKMWNIANSVNRYVISVPFHSYHYPTISSISLCDVFILPKNLTCTTMNSSTIVKLVEPIEPCTLISDIPEHYGFLSSSNTTKSTSFDFQSISCIAGLIDTKHTLGYHHTYTYTKYPVIFPNSYWELFNQTKVALKINSKPLLVVHWRRGDQLTKRCMLIPIKDSNRHKKHKDQYSYHHRQLKVSLDTTLNCHSVDEFIHSIEYLKEQYKIHQQKNMLTYIATNEKNMTILKLLKSKGYKISNDFKNKISIRNDLEEFMMELMLMCNASYFFGWGISYVNNVIRRCRADLTEDRGFVTHINQTGSL